MHVMHVQAPPGPYRDPTSSPPPTMGRGRGRGRGVFKRLGGRQDS